MNPLRMVETGPGKFSLCLDAGSTAVDEAIEKLGHEPNGYFWEGVANWLLEKDEAIKAIKGRFNFDPEGGMFVAYGTDKEALNQLGVRLALLANDVDATTALVKAADEAGHLFDD